MAWLGLFVYNFPNHLMPWRGKRKNVMFLLGFEPTSSGSRVVPDEGRSPALPTELHRCESLNDNILYYRRKVSASTTPSWWAPAGSSWRPTGLSWISFSRNFWCVHCVGLPKEPFSTLARKQWGMGQLWGNFFMVFCSVELKIYF